MCIFESDTVKSDCPMQENFEIFKDLIQTVGLLILVQLFVLEILKNKNKKNSEMKRKKKALKMTIFRAFFSFFFFCPPVSKSEKIT